MQKQKKRETFNNKKDFETLKVENFFSQWESNRLFFLQIGRCFTVSKGTLIKIQVIIQASKTV